MKNHIGLFLVIAFCAGPALATTFGSETDLGKYTSSESLTASGDFADAKSDVNAKLDTKADDEKVKFEAITSWTVGFTTATTKSTDTATQTLVSDRTNQLTGGLEHESLRHVIIGGDVTFANTPDESLTQAGPDFVLGYNYYYNGTESEFSPSIEPKVTLASNAYAQAFSTSTKSRLGRTLPKTGTSSIEQNSAKFEIDEHTTDWFSAKVYYTGYKYNRDVATFVANLDSSRSLNLQRGLGSTVSGLPEHEIGLGLTFQFAETWEADATESVDKSALDGTISHTGKITVADTPSDHWSIGLGYENDNSPGLVDNVLILNLAYMY